MTDKSIESDGSVRRDVVLQVLRGAAKSEEYSITVSENEDGWFTIFRESVPEVIRLEPSVGRRVISRLSNKYDIPMHYFYHPEMM